MQLVDDVEDFELIICWGDLLRHLDCYTRTHRGAVHGLLTLFHHYLYAQA